MFAYEFESGVDDDHRTFPSHLLGDTIAAHNGVEIEKIGRREPGIKTAVSGVHGLVGWQEPTCHLPKCPVA